MKIMWWSASPTHSTGYARCTREITSRLQEDYGHDLAVQCLSTIRERPVQWHGEFTNPDGETEYVRELSEPITIYHSNSKFGLNEVQNNFETFKGDFLFSHFDTWIDPANEIIPNLDIPYGSYVIVDHTPTPNSVMKSASNAYEVVTMSKFAKQQLRQDGLISSYIPHGVDTETYKPLKDNDKPSAVEVGNPDKDETKMVELDDVSFFFIMVATNVGDRKNIAHHMEAYKMFLEEVDNNSLMYIHTDQQSDRGHDLYEVQQVLDIPDEKIIWGRPDLYGKIGDEKLNKWYNAGDVLFNCSFGESFGLTQIESLAAETPVVTSSHSTGPEILGVDPNELNNMEWLDTDDTGWDNQRITNTREDTLAVAEHGLLVRPSVPVWRDRVSSKLYICHPRDIFKAMVYCYNNQDELEQMGEKGREHVKEEYDWDDHVLPKFNDMFTQLEEILP